MLVRPHDRPVHVVLLPIQCAAPVRLALQFRQQARPQPRSLPAVEAGSNGLPGSIAPREISPGRPGLGDPEHAIDDAAMVMVRPATSS
jgi:hypothetical protein